MYQSIASEIGGDCQRPHYKLFYEDLLANGNEVITQLLLWLNLDVDSEWLNIVSSVISPAEPKKYKEEHREIAISLIKEYDSYELFTRYLPL